MFETVSRRAAKAAGLKRYFTGKPCPHGHIAPRYVSGKMCVECNRASALALRANSPAQAKQYDRKRYANERTRRIAKDARRYRVRSKEIKTQKKLYKAANKMKVMAWNRNRKARLRKAEGTHTGEDIAYLLKAQRGKCAACFRRLTSFHVDHVIPLVAGGKNSRDNLQLLCAPCNLAKKAKDPIQFAHEIGRLL